MKDLTLFYSKIIFKEEKLIQPFFIQRSDFYILIVQIYVDDIIFCSSNLSLCENIASPMKGEFEMSLRDNSHSFLDYK